MTLDREFERAIHHSGLKGTLLEILIFRLIALGQSFKKCLEIARSGKIKKIVIERYEMDNPLQIRFKPEKTDYIHASRALASKSTIFVVLAAFTILVMVLSAVLLIFPSIGGGDYMTAAILALLIGGFYFIYYLFLIPFQLSRSYAKNDYLQDERIMTFFDDHITMQIGAQSSDLVWDNVEKVMNGKFLYIIAYKAQEKIYPFFPKSAFSEPGMEENFLELLKEKAIQVK